MLGGSRLHWTGRAVIVPHTEPVMADIIYLPWKLANQLLKLEILNLMVNRYDIPFDQAIYRQITSIVKYDPLVDDIIKTLINESPYGGLCILLGRNP